MIEYPKIIDDPVKRSFFDAGWYAAIDAALKETESLTGDKGTASSGLSRTFRTMAKLRKLREYPNDNRTTKTP
jgi:hypothetical protein